MTIFNSFQSFLEKNNVKEKTAKSYIKDAEDFLHFIEKENIKIVHVKEANIRKFILSLKEEKFSNHTIARKNSALRWYFKYLRKSGMMIENPMEDIKQPELEARDRKLEEAEIKQLISEIKENGKTRDFVIFSLLYKEKIKLSDIITIKKGDFNYKQSILYLGKKAVIISDETKEWLKEVDESTEEGYLFRNERNKKLSESGAYFILKNYFKAIERPDLRPIDLSK